jgi:RNA-directed DNA polymerase
LNPKIQGWANHFRYLVAKKIFQDIDIKTFWALWKWAKRRHPNKSPKWIKEKYFTRIGSRGWCFFSNKTNGKAKDEKLILKLASDTRIKRHVKIRADATPYDPEFKEYFIERQKKVTNEM